MKNWMRVWCLFGGAASSLVVAFPVHAQDIAGQAQDPTADEGTKENADRPDGEIIVSARRFAESLQDAPVAITAYTSETLANLRLDAVDKVVVNIPGASFTQFNKLQSEYGMRGVSSQVEGSSGESSVVTVIDDVIISKDFMKNPAFFDMQQVEVLRGPQGTSFGRNASSGLIHLISARPENWFSGRLAADYGTYQTFNVDGYVTGPLTDTLAGRLAFNFDSHDGYTRDTRLGDRLGAEENTAIRGSLLFEPSSNFSVYLKAEYNRDDDDTPGVRKGKDCSIPFQLAGAPSVVGAPQPVWVDFPSFTDSCDPWETQISDRSFSQFYLKREIINLTSEINYSTAGGLDFTAVTGYLNGDSRSFIDGGGPNNSIFLNTENDAWMFSQELRLSNLSQDSSFSWLVGLFYMKDDHDRLEQGIFYAENAALAPPGGGGGTPISPQNENGQFVRAETRSIQESNNKTESIGVFGEFQYQISDALSISAGLRYSRDDKEYAIANYGYGLGGPIDGFADVDGDGQIIPGTNCVFAPPLDRFNCGTPSMPVGFTDPTFVSDSWENLSGRASLSYEISPDKSVYASVSQGYKSGGFQPQPRTPLEAIEPYDEETVTSYEIGFKGYFGDRLKLNLALFESRYEDLQVFLFATSQSGDFYQLVANAAGVDSRGIEADFEWAVTNNLTLSGNFAFIDSELTNAFIDTDGDGMPEDYSGTRPDNVPNRTSLVAVNYDYPLANGSTLLFRADWRSSSDIYDDLGEQPERRHAAYDIIGGQIGWRSADDLIGLSIWAQNLFEKAYTYNVGPANPNVNQLPFAYGPPRRIGLTLDIGF